MGGHSHFDVKFIYKVTGNLFSADFLMFNWCHAKELYFEHQAAETHRRRTKRQPLFLRGHIETNIIIIPKRKKSYQMEGHTCCKSKTTMPADFLMLKRKSS